MVVNPEDRSSRIEAQIISMRQFHFPQIDFFLLLNNMSSDLCLNVTSIIEGMCCYNSFRYGYTSSAFSNSAQDFSVPPMFIRL